MDGLVYGNLGSGGLSVSPFAERSPGYGRHTIEYRGIDAVGNIGAAGAFVATLIPPPPACTSVVTGRHAGPLALTGTASAPILAGGQVGALVCSGGPAPVDLGAPTAVRTGRPGGDCGA
ncbi:hypothetical protein [Micromonospora sp. WMMD710]|uniref:hypothetical protein n=1 Tax=Micromonospora sp. WMMD710 TaxID=3016085 RepID=UPI002416231E|nr:hypothetical protein [Micromonospora sp. WMMD710]MDG4759030.1 hypothetical protein [Micromonospora sp. WMMD710]